MRKATAEPGLTGLGEILLSREAQKLILLGALVWITGAFLVTWLAGALGLGAAGQQGSIWELGLIAGFVLSSAAVVVYGSLRALLRPRFVRELLAGGSLFSLPVTAGLAALALLPVEIHRFVIRLLGATLLLQVAYLLGMGLVQWKLVPRERTTGNLRRGWMALRRAFGRLQGKLAGWEWPIAHLSLHSGPRSRRRPTTG